MDNKYNKIPNDHQSQDLLCPSPVIISGAKYSGVPQNDIAFSLSFNIFAIPKSASFKYPSSSNRIFSGFKSL